MAAILHAAVIMLLALPLLAEQPIALRPSGQPVVTSQFGGPLLLPVKCDLAGNVYVRGYQYPNPNGAPVVKVPPSGENTVSFDVTSVSGFARANVFDFDIQGGDLYELVGQGQDVFLIAFGRDGTLQSKTRLDSPIYPSHFVVFPNGNFLVWGFEFPRPGSKLKDSLPLTAIFDSSGRLQKRLDVPLEEPGKRTEKGESSAVQDKLRPVALGSVTTDKSGFMYLLPHTADPIVFVVSSAGEVVRKVRIASPRIGYEAEEIKTDGSRLAVQFVATKAKEREEILFVVVDPQTGESFRVYEAKGDLGAALACLTADGFTFVTQRDGKLLLTRAGAP